jgi:G3E family GTPase
MPDFRRVIIETTGLADPSPIVASIGTHPLLVGAFTLQNITTLVDAEHGLARLAGSLTNRNQICLADGLILSKCDRAGSQAIAVLEKRLAMLNPLAPLRRSDKRVEPDFLFGQATAATARSHLHCDIVSDHLAGVSSVLLRPKRPLAWPLFQAWLHALLSTFGSRVMRIKGQLSFQGYSKPFIIQAVHHIFYPVAEADAGADTPERNVLVLIFEGEVPQGLEEAFSQLYIDDRSS